MTGSGSICPALEELACQRWEGERIAEEVFFYDPAQLHGKAPINSGDNMKTCSN